MPTSSVLFAAGRGERMRPITDAVPKPVLPVLDVPLGAFGLTRLLATAPPVTLNVRHLGPTVTKGLSAWGAFETLAEAPEAFGTAGTLRALRSRLDPPVVTYNSDVVSDLDVDALVSAHESGGALGTVAVARVDSAADLEVAGGRAVRLIRRRLEPDAAGFRFLGVAVFSAEALELLPELIPAGLAEGLLAPLIERGQLAVYDHAGFSRDVSTPDTYIEVSLDLLGGRGPDPPGRAGATGGSWPGEIVSVEGGSTYVGPGAEVAGELGPGAIVLAGARVSPGARVARSIVMPGAMVPSGAEITNTVFL